MIDHTSSSLPRSPALIRRAQRVAIVWIALAVVLLLSGLIAVARVHRQVPSLLTETSGAGRVTTWYIRFSPAGGIVAQNGLGRAPAGPGEEGTATLEASVKSQSVFGARIWTQREYKLHAGLQRRSVTASELQDLRPALLASANPVDAVSSNPDATFFLTTDRQPPRHWHAAGFVWVGVMLILALNLLAACVFGTRTYSAWFRRSLRARGLCENCGYSLEGAPSLRCPECGHVRDTAEGATGSQRLR